ncbi:hypothetical protein D8I24_1868 [Cupriavidus necator H850]|nr:hypothetical protein D8I24_1868 [Cupriavidus necator H850]
MRPLHDLQIGTYQMSNPLTAAVKSAQIPQSLNLSILEIFERSPA